MAKPSIAFFGTPAFAVPILEALHHDFEIALVVTQPDKPVGKHLQLQPSPVATKAAELGLATAKPDRLRHESFQKLVQSKPVDVAVVAAYGKILPKWLLEWPKHGMINVHGSLLPKLRGASPIAGAILAGLPVTGVTFMLMNEKMDEGEMLRPFKLPIEVTDTTESLSARMSQLSAAHVSEVVHDWLAGIIEPQAQDHTQATYTTILSKEAGRIAMDQLPKNLGQMVRAYYPWPGVWGEFKGKRVKLLPGGLVQMEGKRAMPLADFLHGYPDFPIKQLD